MKRISPLKKFPHYKQLDQHDCGPTCLRMIADHYGKKVSPGYLKELTGTSKIGATLQGVSKAAEQLGFRTMGVKISFIKLTEEAPLPAIVHWHQNHFIVVYNITKAHVMIADPGHGLLSYTKEEFLKQWISQPEPSTESKGIVLLLEPTPTFEKLNVDEDKEQNHTFGIRYLWQYVVRYKPLLLQMTLGLLVGSVLQLIFPFLTQSIVDLGIKDLNLNLVYLLLTGQLMVFIGQSAIEVIRGWILLHMSTRINISIISDFFMKLMRLPISYFDAKVTGDIMQRINDHNRLERLLTSTTLSVIFSAFTLLVLGGVLAMYNMSLFLVFIIGTLIYFGWVLIYLKRRRDLDYKRFHQMASEQSKVIELLNGMQEIKLHNAERPMRWGWENLQVKLFKISISSLSLEQIQTVGSNIINELKNILITFLAAKLVIQGELTLGMMLAVSYIVGQMNSPLLQLVGFLHSLQDAKISIERLGEIHQEEEEEPRENAQAQHVPNNGAISLENVSFSYTGSKTEVLKRVKLTIPANKVTAIVGVSGSGKTTLMKLLLGFYKPSSGQVKVGDIDLNTISPSAWRDQVGMVMQEGFIFNDSLAANIAIGEDIVDEDRLIRAGVMANVHAFAETLPLGYNTKIGQEGLGLSTGQKQRIRIARAIYKNPSFLFFDEATSALDANNERDIMSKLNDFFKNRTVIVIAHRLSTVKEADQIVVLNQGTILETGTHKSLIEAKGEYYNLVKNQLELNKIQPQKKQLMDHINNGDTAPLIAL